MDTNTLLSILSRHGLAVDEWRGGAGKYRDLYIGTGQPFEVLRAAQRDMKAAGLTLVTVECCDVPAHPAYGKQYLCIGSFWWEDAEQQPIRAADFFLYHAGPLAVDKNRPWQLCAKPLPALCGRFATEEAGRRALEALQADKDAGKLPCNLSTWDKAHLLRD